MTALIQATAPSADLKLPLASSSQVFRQSADLVANGRSIHLFGGTLTASRLDHVRIKLELGEIRGRKGEPVADYRAIENAVAIEKDGPLTYFVLSHFVCAVLSAG